MKKQKENPSVSLLKVWLPNFIYDQLDELTKKLKYKNNFETICLLINSHTILLEQIEKLKQQEEQKKMEICDTNEQVTFNLGEDKL